MSNAKKKMAVYTITNTVSGSFYVGSSTNLYERWRTHRKKLRTGTHPNPRLQSSWRKHGEDAFTFTIVAEFDDAIDMEQTEEILLVELLADALCCNLSANAKTPWRNKGRLHPNHGRPMSQEQKEKLRAIALKQWAEADPRTGRKHSDATKAIISAKVQAAVADGRGGKFIPSAETRAKMSAANMGNPGPKGHIRSEEHRQRLSEANKGNQNWLGKTHSEEAKARMGKAVRAYAPDGTITTYPRTTAIKEQMGIFLPTLLRSIRSGEVLKKGAYKGWRFEYA